MGDMRRVRRSVRATACAALAVLWLAIQAVPAHAGAPNITSFSPQSGPAGTTVTIRGTGFTGATLVEFNGVDQSVFTVNSNTRITANVPTGASTGKISVTTPDGTDASADDFIVTANDDPSITSFSPANGPVGTSVSINGVNFDGATSVTFNGVSASFTVNSSLKITATVPSTATNGPIVVTTPDGTDSSSPDNFTVTAGAAPTITSFSPTFGEAGTVVTINGTGFTGTTDVKFDNKSAAFTVDSPTRIRATVPNGAQTGPISVTTPAGTATSATEFVVSAAPPPEITSFSPTSGPVGTKVTITGSAFTGATAVKFNGVSATFKVDSDTQISATVPDAARTGPISVTTPNGTDTSSTNFTVTSPFISSFSPRIGPWGTTVVITGANLSGTTSVRFDGTSASFSVSSGTQIVATVPNGATTGRITVTGPAGTGTSADDFTVKHLRRITLSLAGHLVASGTVSVLDGTSACTSTVPVKIQRRVSGTWKTVGTTTTNGAGGYSVDVVDREGRYRAVATRSVLANDDVCGRTKSGVVFNA